jgi:hypothetical protein
MTDFVYICKDGINEELKYSIRSVSFSFPDSNIWVVGGKPDWYIGNYIEVEQKDSKYKNAVRNLETICNSQEISESFILMNDDFYIVKKIDKIENFHGGFLLDKINLYQKLNSNSQYTRKLSRTYNKLKALGFEDPLDYELHIPMIMEKEKLKTIIELLDQFLWRSIYGNKFNVGGTQMEDVKVYNSGPLVLKSYDLNVDDHTYLSSADSSFNSIFNKILKFMFDKKTKFEK